ncbi:MAG: metallophosphoesterase [Arcobacteraceae bacterium]|nr:metallophosphoesterase [Arcobacteraceae bacterium]
MLLNLQDGAIFIADSHYNKNRISFEKFLDDILNNKIKTTQLFLMGDIFDFLSEEIDYFKTVNNNIIKKIDTLSNIIEIIYLEGNHDFNLATIFPNIKVIKREKQPFIVQSKERYLSISHGDIFTPTLYNIFCTIIRNRYILKCLNFLDINNFISKWLENKLIKKDICNDLLDFDSFAQNRIDSYKRYDDITFIIEGHYHQGKSYKNYSNIPSFACSNFYSKLKNEDNKIFLENIQY